MLAENNVRERILTDEEYLRLLEKCSPHIRPIVEMAYVTGMRRGEILGLTWDQVDLKKGFVRLSPGMTKTKTGRSIPVPSVLVEMLSRIPRPIHTNRVFLFQGKPIQGVKTAFSAACRRAGIMNFTFHDLRHCALNNLRLAGNDYFKIMALSGHKTMAVFKRYNLVTEEELSKIAWPGNGVNSRTMDTYMDTRE